MSPHCSGSWKWGVFQASFTLGASEHPCHRVADPDARVYPWNQKFSSESDFPQVTICCNDVTQSQRIVLDSRLFSFSCLMGVWRIWEWPQFSGDTVDWWTRHSVVRLRSRLDNASQPIISLSNLKKQFSFLLPYSDRQTEEVGLPSASKWSGQQWEGCFFGGDNSDRRNQSFLPKRWQKKFSLLLVLKTTVKDQNCNVGTDHRKVLYHHLLLKIWC